MSLDEFFFCKQKTAYEMRIGDWSSDVCSSDFHAAMVHRVSHPLILGSRRVRRGIVRGVAFMSVLRECRTTQAARQRENNEVAHQARRSEERRVWKECVSTCRSRGSPYY